MGCVQAFHQGVSLAMFSIILIIICQVFSVGSIALLAAWSDDVTYGDDNAKQNLYLSGYVSFGLAEGGISRQFIETSSFVLILL